MSRALSCAHDGKLREIRQQPQALRHHLRAAALTLIDADRTSQQVFKS
jgi:hypothetical protein